MSDEISLGEIGRRLENIESKIDKALDDHEVRIRSLEKWMYALPASLVLSIGSVGVTIFLAIASLRN